MADLPDYDEFTQYLDDTALLLQDAHAACPDDWPGCNVARDAAPILMRMLREAVAALKAARMAQRVYPSDGSLAFDHTKNAQDALARIAAMVPKEASDA